MEQRVYEMLINMQQRRSVRKFSSTPVPVNIIKNCIRVAASAPSGANQQPWHFVVVTDPLIKKQIRTEAEKIEYDFYTRTAPQSWLDALKPFGTNFEKPFLEEAPFLIILFMKKYDLKSDGTIVRHYYPLESASISLGMLLTAIHTAGLSSLVYTPAKMGFLKSLLNRPENEKALSIVVAGFPNPDFDQPLISKKPLNEFVTLI